MAIDTRYTDILDLIKELLDSTAVAFTDDQIYSACLTCSRNVYGYQDWVYTRKPDSYLKRQSDVVHRAIAAPWVGRAAIDDPVLSDTTPTFTDSSEAAIIPSAQDLRRGFFTFAGTDISRVYITGIWVDIYGAAAECLGYILSGKVNLDDVVRATMADGTSIQMSSPMAVIRQQQAAFLSRAFPMG